MLGGSFWIAFLRNAISVVLMLSFFFFHEKNGVLLCHFWRVFNSRL